jgi:hypothetical protein
MLASYKPSKLCQTTTLPLLHLLLHHHSHILPTLQFSLPIPLPLHNSNFKARNCARQRLVIATSISTNDLVNNVRHIAVEPLLDVLNRIFGRSGRIVFSEDVAADDFDFDFGEGCGALDAFGGDNVEEVGVVAEGASVGIVGLCKEGDVLVSQILGEWKVLLPFDRLRLSINADFKLLHERLVV